MSDPALPRRGMSPRVLAALVLIAVGALGVVAGIALDRTILRSHAGREGRVPYWARSDSDRRRYWDRISSRLHISAEQGTAIDSILAQQGRLLRDARKEVDPKMSTIMDGTKLRIDSVLTPDQRALLQALRRERERRREQR